ncbi:MAG TPA: OmpA family protein [Flavobacteriaceae bacterium]|nr:OmpA family protein [Flavobacteriaceae bacterium]MCB9212719.1 OmpA family protein [Alteromonas sp.]HPF11766.1 OmpA family protein [Flavobacteriaceae bacterium]HQU20792.1 OmpA family protein [Flavobacteriaceae bacterium]HQU64967.1 OmpA family protein [Flavobacteriaceae bacterium]
MKKIVTYLFIMTVSLTVAQNKDTKKADDLYHNLAFTDAADAYQNLLKKGKGSRYVFERLANCYYYINDTKKAETYYKRVVKGKKVDPETVYNYAQCLKANGKFSEYNSNMQDFAQMQPSDSRAMEFMKNPNYVPKMMEDFQRFEVKNLEDLNSEYSDFGGIVVGKDFYFASARNKTRKKYRWDEEYFLDVYKASLVGNTVKNAELLAGDVNSKFHEGIVAISPDGKRIYFDRNDYFNGKYDKSEDGINQINLYYSEWVDGHWKGVFSVPFNSSEYSTGHPALSPNGNMLYFVSDKPGGKGDSDIYRVSIDAEGNFGTPEMLGGDINTEGKEVFPYIDSNGNLYFSSNGHQGLGGLDIFYAEAKGNGFENSVNIGKDANTSDDDFAFIYDPNTETGYLSSNRPGGKGSDDIYQVKAVAPPCDVNIDVTVVNEYTGAPLFGAVVSLYDTQENKLSTKSSAEDGSATLIAACDQEHLVQAGLVGFETNAIEIGSETKTTNLTKTIKLRPIEAIIVDDKIQLDPILFDYNKFNIKPQAAFELDKLVGIMKKYPNMKISVESHTDTRGNADYNRELSEKRAQATVQYVISQGIDASRISGKGFGEDNPAIKCGNNCSDADHQKNRRSEFIIIER